MASKLQRALASTVVLLMSLPYGSLPASATCGGGGGGGRGGAMGGGGKVAAEVYHVPWKILEPGQTATEGALFVYWFPTSEDEARESKELLTSRYLTLSSSQCVTMALVTDSNKPLRTKYAAAADAPTAVLAGKDGAELGRVQADKGKLHVEDIEDLLRKEIEAREDAAKKLLEDAKEKASQKDADGAAAIYAKLWEDRCLLPSEAKKAAKGLKKLGRPVAEEESSSLIDTAPNFSEPVNTLIVQTMTAGLTAERDGKVLDAKRLYLAARKLDPADPVPVRFLGELLRHETGEWVEARALFNQVLAMRADPLSRAVALHGLGKMTIHDGGFKKGLELFNASLQAYPLALTYRNLAVYWNSEKNHEKAHGYVQKAMALEPDDLYNQIFAATYLVKLGQPKEAEEIARRHEGLIEASYNLAAIHAQLGNKEKALELLRRHFYVYEKFDAVRAKEMQEARDDIAFAAYHQDPDFVKLTAMAGTDASSYHRNGA